MCQNGCSPAPTNDTLVFGEDGELNTSLTGGTSELIVQQPCPIRVLNGSWLLEVLPRIPFVFSPRVRGLLRIEVGPSSLRCSGDIYTRRPFFPAFSEGTTAGENVIFPGPQPWYPSFPKNPVLLVLPLERSELHERHAHGGHRSAPVESGHPGVRLHRHPGAELPAGSGRLPRGAGPGDAGHPGDRGHDVDRQGDQDLGPVPRVPDRGRRDGQSQLPGLRDDRVRGWSPRSGRSTRPRAGMCGSRRTRSPSRTMPA